MEIDVKELEKAFERTNVQRKSAAALDQLIAKFGSEDKTMIEAREKHCAKIYREEEKKLVDSFQNYELIDLDKSEVSKVDSFENSDGSYCEERERCFLSALMSVGIKSRCYDVMPQFFPHNRDFFLLRSVGDFTWNSETIEEWNVPEMGAEKFPKKRLGSVSVMSPVGIVGVNEAKTVITHAREKLDGFETVVFSIKTRNYEQCFLWSDLELRMIDGKGCGLFERVGDRYYHLVGDNVIGGIPHEWQFVSHGLIERCKGADGMIVLMDGKQYRLPNFHSATLYSDGEKSSDYSNAFVVPHRGREVGRGLHDWKCELQKDGSLEWVYWKPRKDKTRPDSQGGINDMVSRSAILSDFLNKASVPYIAPMKQAVDVVVVPLVNERIPWLTASRISIIPIRMGQLKADDSYRRLLLLQSVYREVNINEITIRTPNVMCSSGRVTIIPRHKLGFYKYKGRVYTTDCWFGRGRVLYFKFKRRRDDLLYLGGEYVMRLFEIDYKRFEQYLIEQGINVDEVALTRPKFYN